MFKQAEVRINIIHEATVVWPEIREGLRELGGLLIDVEIRVVNEARKYVEGLHPEIDEPEQVDRNILYANGEGEDAVNDEYSDLIERISNLISPKVHMR